MFGYVKPHVPDLLVKENAFYKSVYCGLCHELKKKSLILPFTLSYDFVFLCVLRLAVSHDEIKVSQKRCFVHPVRKKPYLCSTPSLDYGARASAMLLYRNIEDDVRDSKGFKRVAYKIALSKAKDFFIVCNSIILHICDQFMKSTKKKAENAKKIASSLATPALLWYNKMKYYAINDWGECSWILRLI